MKKEPFNIIEKGPFVIYNMPDCSETFLFFKFNIYFFVLHYIMLRGVVDLLICWRGNRLIDNEAARKTFRVTAKYLYYAHVNKTL